MKKKELKYLVPILIVLVVLTIIKVLEPEEIDWSHSFARKDKTPFGGYIISELTRDLFPGEKITVKEFPIYNTLKDNYFNNTNYIFINSYFSPDELDTEYLLQYVAEGNNVFISAFGINRNLADSLKIKSYEEFFSEDTVNTNLNLSGLRTEIGWEYTGKYFNTYFSEFDTTKVQVLGSNELGKANFLRIKYGKGNFFLHSLPLIFTNYHLLYSGNNEYVYKILSHLPDQKTIWDDYYKEGNRFNASSLKYVISQKSLRCAYYIILLSVLLFIFLYGRRKQRIIPVIPPLANTTVEFVETVGNLYYQQKDFKNIAEKKISYFLDYLRNKYFIKTNLFDEYSIQKIADKSTLSLGKIKSIFNEIKRINESPTISESDLLNLNYKIENIYESTR